VSWGVRVGLVIDAQIEVVRLHMRRTATHIYFKDEYITVLYIDVGEVESAAQVKPKEAVQKT